MAMAMAMAMANIYGFLTKMNGWGSLTWGLACRRWGVAGLALARRGRAPAAEGVAGSVGSGRGGARWPAVAGG